MKRGEGRTGVMVLVGVPGTGWADLVVSIFAKHLFARSGLSPNVPQLSGQLGAVGPRL